MKTELYNFSHTDEAGITTTLTFTVPAVGATLSTYVDMCKRAAIAIGYSSSSVEKEFNGETMYEPFEEFYEEDN